MKTALGALSTISGNEPSGGSLEVKVIDSLPPFGLLAIDSNKPTGRIRVELYLDSCPIGERPVFELLASRDGKWYNLFRQQFEILWQKASETKGLTA